MYYNFSGLSIFVLDDTMFMRRVLRSLCRALNVGTIGEAANVADACEALNTFSTDIVITDWHMDPTDGLELVRYLRTDKDSPNPYVPIIMLTGDGVKERVLTARDAGVNTFMGKPVSARGLYQRLVWLIENPFPFVRTKTFFGPDRRRNNLGSPLGVVERRKEPLSKTFPAAA